MLGVDVRPLLSFWGLSWKFAPEVPGASRWQLEELISVAEGLGLSYCPPAGDGLQSLSL